MQIVIGRAFVLVFLLAATVTRSLYAQAPDLRAQTAAGITQLQTWYTPATGLYATTGWWNAANAITTVVNYSIVTGSKKYEGVLANTWKQAPSTHADFLNKFYDDEGWWALAWIAAYDKTHEQRYLASSVIIFHDMAGGWDDTCGGGIWWSKDRTYKNAIANELFLSVAAELANRAAPAERTAALGWAKKEWAWFQQTGMINGKHLINDGLDAQCKNNGRTTWSYNQGVVLGGLVALNKVQSDPQLLATAQTIAAAAMQDLSDKQGILHDVCEPKCGEDGTQFKGVFLRNLMALHAAAPDARYAAFAKANAESIWEHSRDAKNAFGQVWLGPVEEPNASSQSSALDAFVAALAMSR